MTDTGRQDRAVRLIAIGSAVLAVITLIVALISLPVLLDASGGVRATNRAGEIANCKSHLNAQVVIAKSEVDDVILDGLIAAATGDDAAMDSVIDRIAPVRVRRDAAVDAYGQGTALADADPAAFLAGCRARTDP